MADLIFNIAKGRLVQLAKNVDDGSPANSRSRSPSQLSSASAPRKN